MRMNRSDLYDLIALLCDGEYAIGMHGIDEQALKRKKIEYSPTEAASNILKKGLKASRPINGTVRFFGRIDLEEDKQTVMDGISGYSYLCSDDYVIVAIPSIIRNGKGEELYLGCPNLESEFQEYMDSTGYEKTTLLEKAILKDSTLSPDYILCSFRVVDEEGNIDLDINPYHISYSKGIVSDEEFKRIQTWVQYYLGFLRKCIPDFSLEKVYKLFSEPLDAKDISYLEKILHEIRCSLDSSNGLSEEYAPIGETIKQLLNEKGFAKSI